MRQKHNLSYLSNLIFPQHCLLCNQESRWYLCRDCLQSITPYAGNRCLICSKPIPYTQSKVICPICLSKKRYFNKGFSLFDYKDEEIKKIVELIKFYRHPKLTDVLLYFEDYIKSLEIFSGCDYLIPVPMHKKDIKERGYNQAVSIAKTVSKITKIPVKYSGLEKTKQTEKQVGLDYNKRTKNVSGAFIANRNIKAKRIVLIDDVLTTGSTINECAKTLLKNKTSSNFFTLATTPSVF